MLGRTLGPYRLVAELGAGGMGKVYRAEPAQPAAESGAGGSVALKVVHPHLLATAGMRERFLREGGIGRRIRHPNVVATLDVGECEGVLWLAMEYVEGQTLRSLLAEMGRVPEELCRHVGREVAKALGAVHAAGAVHRDVKPENVIISRCAVPGHDHVAERPGTASRESEGHVHHRCEHEVKLMDLGVARLLDETTRLSQTGAFVGSVEYAAPEQFRSDSVDGRADLHSLGLVLYELASGVNPYHDADFARIFGKILNETPRRIHELNPQLSPFFEETVHRLLEKDRDKRFASADELARVLDTGERSTWWAARAVELRSSTRRPLRRIRIPRETALVGRDAELARLRALFDRAAGGDGQVVLVEGEAGIGKSRLVDEFLGRLAESGEPADCLHGTYPSGGAATGTGAFVEALGGRLADGADLARALRATPVLVPAFSALLRGDTPPAGAEPLAADSLRTAFVHATSSLAAECTTVLFIDGLHDAPAEGRSILAALVHAAPGRRLLVIAASRPGLPAAWVADISRLPQTSRMVLPRLPDADVETILRGLLRPRSLMDELPSQIVAKAGGNPFAVFEILRGLRESGLLRPDADGILVRTSATGIVQVPSSLRDMTAARIVGLTHEDRELLDVASCCGQDFDPLVLGEVLGVARIPLLRSLGRIEKEHGLVRSAGARFVFDHVQVRETLYEALSEPLRREYHAALGGVVERRGSAGRDDAWTSEAVSHHLRGTDPARASPHLDAAMRRLRARGSVAAAAALADAALSVPHLLAGRARLDVLLANTRHFDLLGRVEDEGRVAEEALALATALGDRASIGVVSRAMGWRLSKLSKYDEAAARLAEALEIAQSTGDRSAEEHATRLLGIVHSHRGRFEEAGVFYERARAIARETGDRNAEAGSTINLSIDLSSRGLFERARTEAEHGIALAREVGNRRWEANALSSMLSASISLGLYGDGLSTCEQSLRVARETGYRKAEEMALANLAEIVAALGDDARAAECFEAALALSRDLGDRKASALRTAQLGTLRERAGDAPAAERAYRDALARLREVGDVFSETAAALRLGSLLRRDGRVDEARALLGEVSRSAAENDMPDRTVLAAAESALLPGGDVAAARAALDLAAPRLEWALRMEAHHLVGLSTHDRAHRTEARRLLDHLVANAPERYRASMLSNVPLHREIAEASSR